MSHRSAGAVCKRVGALDHNRRSIKWLKEQTGKIEGMPQRSTGDCEKDKLNTQAAPSEYGEAVSRAGQAETTTRRAERPSEACNIANWSVTLQPYCRRRAVVVLQESHNEISDGEPWRHRGGHAEERHRRQEEELTLRRGVMARLARQANEQAHPHQLAVCRIGAADSGRPRPVQRHLRGHELAPTATEAQALWT